MSIIRKETVVRAIEEASAEELREILHRFLNTKMADYAKSRLYRIALNLGQDPREVSKAKLTKEWSVPVKSLDALAASPMMDYVEELIRAALDPRGPYQSREVMLIAASKKEGHAPFITNHGIPQQYKNQAGYILTMAGFERVSHYDRERKMPLKCWKPKHGTKGMTIEERVQEVHTLLRDHCTNIETPVENKQQPINLLRSFL